VLSWRAFLNKRGTGDHSTNDRDGFRKRQKENRNKGAERMRSNKIDQAVKMGHGRSLILQTPETLVLLRKCRSVRPVPDKLLSIRFGR
jgi:hypothetical protein